jgi:glucosamine-6-phosphate deaminase
MNGPESFEIDAINVQIHADKYELGRSAARFVGQIIAQSIRDQESARVIFATGASQYEFLDALCALANVDWRRVTAFHLDEYLNLPVEHPASFRKYLQDRLFSLLPFGAVHLLDGNAADPQAECARYSELLTAAPIDLACIGIGENAHLAFNDPPADFAASALVHVVTLDTACRQQQVGEGHFASLDEVPQQALSLSIPAILRAHTISCVVPDQRKAAAVYCALRGPITPDCPASALRQHTHTHLFLDVNSASRIANDQ